MSATLANTIYGVVAMANVDADAATPVYRAQRGFGPTAILRNGIGDYTHTLTEAQDLANNGVVKATRIAATPGMIGVELVSATTLRVRTMSSAAAADETDYSLEISKIGPA